MQNSPTAAFESEWITLQNQYDSYEKYALVIKLLSVALCASLLFHHKLDYLFVVLLALCWLIESIWKTFQSRISVRLIKIEHAIAQQQSAGAMQFHCDWLATRPSGVKLVLEYLKNSLTPTVLVPHGILCSVGAYVAYFY
ncbi:hypothetical protein [Aliiglaciecola litoralis]|uniref:Uncharacterized protein n=1 Tax=Aliiglaciecola litoralis TaxID=582857 RepID=A0ABP3WPL2_9ALTE